MCTSKQGRDRTFAFPNFFQRWSLAALVCLFGCLNIGCQERNIAPAVEYSPERVELLDNQLSEIDWDE